MLRVQACEICCCGFCPVSSGLSPSAGSASSAFETYTPRPGHALQPRCNRGARARRRPPLPALTPPVRVVSRGQGGITEGLVKGALSVAASAYKALFTGPNCSVQVGSSPLRRTKAEPAFV